MSIGSINTHFIYSEYLYYEFGVKPLRLSNSDQCATTVIITLCTQL